MEQLRKILALLLFVVQSIFLFAEEKSFVVYDSSGYPHLLVNENILSVINNDTIVPNFQLKGNQIFFGSKNATLLFQIKRAQGFFGEASRIVFPKTDKTVLTFYNNKVYWGQNISQNPVVGIFDMNDEGQTGFIDAYTGNVLFHFNLKNIPNNMLIAITAYFVQHYQLEISTVEQLPFENYTFTEDDISLVRYVGDVAELFVWDGRLLHNVTTGNKVNVWAFDGKNIFRYYYDTGDDLIWDGNSVKRKWVRWEDYFKQGNMLIHSTINSSMKRQYLIQNNIVRAAWEEAPESAYIELYHDIPDALLIALTFRLIN